MAARTGSNRKPNPSMISTILSLLMRWSVGQSAVTTPFCIPPMAVRHGQYRISPAARTSKAFMQRIRTTVGQLTIGESSQGTQLKNSKVDGRMEETEGWETFPYASNLPIFQFYKQTHRIFASVLIKLKFGQFVLRLGCVLKGYRDFHACFRCYRTCGKITVTGNVPQANSLCYKKLSKL